MGEILQHEQQVSASCDPLSQARVFIFSYVTIYSIPGSQPRTKTILPNFNEALSQSDTVTEVHNSSQHHSHRHRGNPDGGNAPASTALSPEILD